MRPREVKPGIYFVGAIDWNRQLFDALIPLPEGTSYNSYLINGSDKTALIDTVDPTKQGELMDFLGGLGLKKIDYVIANHAEQDHSGALPLVLERYPEAKVVTNSRCQEMLIDLLLIPGEKFITINEHDTLPLGGRTLEFIYTPWVHWPETMCTYLKEDKILFSCDFFGSHLATTELYVSDEKQVYDAAKRYYAEIMMPFRTSIQRNLEKIRDYKIDIIAPSHGPMYDRPEFILKAYHSWVFDEPKNMVVLPYVSMHGSTQKMVAYLSNALAERGVSVKQYDLSQSDLGKLSMALVDAATLVIASPTFLVGAHPAAVYAAFLANALRPKLRLVSVIGSYGWGGKMVEQLTGLLSNLKAEILEPVICKGFPREDDFKALDNLAATIARKHQEYNFS